MYKFFFYFLLFFKITIASAQVQISGKVTDENNQALAYANVLLLTQLDSFLVKGGVTNENGIFTIEHLESGDYFLKISMIGYDDKLTEAFEIDENKKDALTIDVVLKESNITLDEVIIKAKKPLLEQKIDRTVVNVKNSIVAISSDVLTILERSPGVEIDRINNQIHLQGKQGVIVLIDGKKIQMDGAGLVQLLKGMTAENINAIELITTPPASFDADGDAGIINIQTIKQETEGIHLSTALNVAYGKRSKLGGSFNLNLKKNKISFFANGSGNYNRTQEDVQIFRSNRHNNMVTTTDINSLRPAITGLYNYRLGLDYHITKNTTVGLLFSGYLRTWDMDAEMNSFVIENVDSGFHSLNQARERNDWMHWMGGFNINHQFKDESQLQLHYDYLGYQEENPVDYQEDIKNLDNISIEENNFFSRKNSEVEFQVIRLDYNKSISEQWKLSTGSKTMFSSLFNDVRLARQSNGTFVNDPKFTDTYNLSEKLFALYSSIDFIANSQLSFKAGLRYEYFDSELTARTGGEILLQSYGRFFPSFYLTYKINENQQWQLAYSERITRPTIRNIAPAFTYWGYNTILSGNPEIRPTISRRWNLTYRFKTIFLQFQFSDDDNALTFQPMVVAADNLVFDRSENMPDRKTVMLSLNAPVQWTNWWESRFSSAIYWARYQPLVEGEPQTITNWRMTASVVNSFQMQKGFAIELSTKLYSKRRSGLGNIPAKVIFDLGLKKTINSRFNVAFNWQNMFNTGAFYAINIDEPDLNLVYDWRYNIEGNVFRLSFMYNFGNVGVKGKQKVVGAEEERRRMN